MIDQATFSRYVREAFAHLDDRPYLSTHPLGEILQNSREAASADLIRKTLLAAIEQLCPPKGTPPGSTNWRRWQCLALRYSEGASTARIAQKLVISERQARRDHLLGIESVSAILWASLRPQIQARQRGDKNDTPVSLPVDAADPDSTLGQLDRELAQVMTAESEGPTSVVEVLENALATVREMAVERGVRFAVGLPEISRSVTINAAVLRQIVLCLLTACLEEDAASEIALTVENLDAAVRLQISALATRRANEPVANARPPRPEGEVENLLRTALHLAQAQGGKLDIKAEPGQCFSTVLVLPSKRVATVLVIDDNPDIAELFRRYLTGLDYRVVQARTPPTALELANELHPDVIILDVMMPSRDGWQILHGLRGREEIRPVPVIVCSILPEKALALSLGVADFLAKPVRRQDLLVALERCLASRLPAARPDSLANSASSPQP